MTSNVVCHWHPIISEEDRRCMAVGRRCARSEMCFFFAYLVPLGVPLGTTVLLLCRSVEDQFRRLSVRTKQVQCAPRSTRLLFIYVGLTCPAIHHQRPSQHLTRTVLLKSQIHIPSALCNLLIGSTFPSLLSNFSFSFIYIYIFLISLPLHKS